MTKKGYIVLGALLGFALLFFGRDLMVAKELPPTMFNSTKDYESWKRLMSTPEGRTAWRDAAGIVATFERDYHRKLTAKEVFEALPDGLTEKDPHSSILTARQFRDFQTTTRGSFGGIGTVVGPTTDKDPVKGIRVIEPSSDDSPGFKAGLKPGDVIIEIKDHNGVSKPTATMTVEDAVDLLRGPENTPVEFTVRRAGEKDPIAIKVVRGTISLKYVKHELRQDVGYIKLTSFGGGMTDQFRNAVQALEAESMTKNGRSVSGYVLDLRSNPGGLLDEADSILDATLDKKMYVDRDAATTISVESRGERTGLAHALRAEDVLDGKPLVVLVNGGSASASEIVAGVLQIHGRATIAGAVDRTFGKGTVQSIIPQQSGGAVRLTTSQYLIGSKGCEHPVQGKGVVPDIRLEDEPTRIEFPHEESLPESIKTSDVSDAKCKYRFKVSDEHRKEAQRMLEVMSLKLAKR